MSDPQISIDLARIEHNARTVVDLCKSSGITPFGVTKGTCGMPQVARAMLRGIKPLNRYKHSSCARESAAAITSGGGR